MSKYNGWTNRETWNVNLWMHIDDRLASLWQARTACLLEESRTLPVRDKLQGVIEAYEAGPACSADPWTPEGVRDFVLNVMRGGFTPDGDSVILADFDQLADQWSNKAMMED